MSKRMVPFDWGEELKAITELLRPELMFEGSCDFLLGWELLAVYRETPAVRENRAFVPIQARATCASMALELALKSLITYEGKDPALTHSFARLFKQLLPKTRREIASIVLLNGNPTSVEGVIDALKLCERTFETWRYKHEHDNADFYEPYIIDVTKAVHKYIMRKRPECRAVAARYFAK